jgi:glyoxylase-like metal-dependent hydrolase (beta-lactamase superfamily II)
MALTPFVCGNCGFWQIHFAAPRGCPVCEDVRHTPPPDGYRFLTPAEANVAVRCRWQEIVPGVVMLANDPPLGLGVAGWLLRHPEGNLLFESPAWLNDAALDQIESLGGVHFAAASHPHAYGALWRVQERFAPELLVQREDLGWTQTLRVGWPFDNEIELLPGLRLIHTGGHFAGHAVLHDAARQALFAGDAVKVHFAAGRPAGLSCHKGFNRQIPLSHAELRRYRDVLAPLRFTAVFTSFEHGCGVGRDAVLRLLDARLAGRPSCEPVAL